MKHKHGREYGIGYNYTIYEIIDKINEPLKKININIDTGDLYKYIANKTIMHLKDGNIQITDYDTNFFKDILKYTEQTIHGGKDNNNNYYYKYLKYKQKYYSLNAK